MFVSVDPLQTMADVRARFGVSRSWVYSRLAEGRFPQPLRLSERAIRWPKSALDAFEASLEQGGTARG
jgi:predicted DNA-binding transcriptional regulator AlpA